jgi:hypothetical protein
MASKRWRSYAAGSEVDHFAKFAREHLVQSEDRWDGKRFVLEPIRETRPIGEVNEAIADVEAGRIPARIVFTPEPASS